MAIKTRPPRPIGAARPSAIFFFFALPGITNGAGTEGYHIPVNLSIMKAPYYFSYLADAAPKVLETPLNGAAGQIELPMSREQEIATTLPEFGISGTESLFHAQFSRTKYMLPRHHRPERGMPKPESNSAECCQMGATSVIQHIA